MRLLTLFSAGISFLLIAVVSGCTPDTGPIPDKPTHDLQLGWGLAGLQGVLVKSLNNFDGYVYAATDSGLYRTSISDNHILWKPLGLQKKTVLGVAFLPGNKLLATVYVPSCCRMPSLFLSANGGQSWRPYMNNFGGPSGKFTLTVNTTAISKPSDTLFTQVGTGGGVARSFDGGKHWKAVIGGFGLRGGVGGCLFVDPFTKGNIWVGASNALSASALFKTKDYGKTWTRLQKHKHIGANIYSIIVKPHQPGHVLAATGDIAKSTDGGHTWHYIEPVHFGAVTFEYSARDPMVIYAGGRNRAGTLFLATSTDFGDTWKVMKWKDSPTDIFVNDLISVIQNGHEVLYFGTNKGVYSYMFEK